MIEEWEGVEKGRCAKPPTEQRSKPNNACFLSGNIKRLSKKKHNSILLICRKMAKGNHKEQIRRTDGGKNVIRDGSSRSMQHEMRSSKSYYVQEDRRGFGTGLRADAEESAMTPLGRA